jgi:hypothetical protein
MEGWSRDGGIVMRRGPERAKPRRLPSPAALALIVIAAVPFAGASADHERSEHPLSHEFYFTRGIYSAGGGSDDWGARWAVDYPKAEHQFLVALERLTGVDAYASHNAVELAHPRLRDFPFLYVLEVGSLLLTDADVTALREYLGAGGFMVVDDFWGTSAWRNFEAEMRRVFPDRPLVDVPPEHPVFHAYYQVDEILQVPNVYQAGSGPTHEYDGYVPRVRGIFDDAGRLMVLVNWNTDLGDAWEWADSPDYPLRYSTFAFELGVNFVIYAMSY